MLSKDYSLKIMVCQLIRHVKSVVISGHLHSVIHPNWFYFSQSSDYLCNNSLNDNLLYKQNWTILMSLFQDYEIINHLEITGVTVLLATTAVSACGTKLIVYDQSNVSLVLIIAALLAKPIKMSLTQLQSLLQIYHYIQYSIVY